MYSKEMVLNLFMRFNLFWLKYKIVQAKSTYRVSILYSLDTMYTVHLLYFGTKFKYRLCRITHSQIQVKKENIFRLLAELFWCLKLSVIRLQQAVIDGKRTGHFVKKNILGKYIS